MKISKKDNLMSDSKVIKKELPGEKMRKLKQKNKGKKSKKFEEMFYEMFCVILYHSFKV